MSYMRHLANIFYPLQVKTKMKIFSESHKTVFVVDHCPYMAESCRQHVEFDMLVKNRTQGIIPLAPISKSLWTCSVESSMEYCRIMYDIFPFKKLVSVKYKQNHHWGWGMDLTVCYIFYIRIYYSFDLQLFTTLKNVVCGTLLGD